MNILLIGDFSPNLDEGYKNISYYLADGLDKNNNVIRLSSKRIIMFDFWNTFLRSKPDIIHIITQPTNLSLIFSLLVKKIFTNVPLVISALRPENYYLGGHITTNQRILVRLIHPELILVQSEIIKSILDNLGIMAKLLSNGVNLERFHPSSIDEKIELRLRYGINPDLPVILHVGHLNNARNLLALKPLITNNIQVVIAGSIYMGIHKDLINQFEDVGFLIFTGFQSNIEEFYMLSDCYIFPLEPGNSISMPLSVLEAMACNLPIVTQRFLGLDEFFKEGGGFCYWDGKEPLLSIVKCALNSSPITRKMVQDYSWNSVVDQLEIFYTYVKNK
jgi:glycosyltransferase involved in cell wall biosynthesis